MSAMILAAVLGASPQQQIVWAKARARAAQRRAAPPYTSLHDQYVDWAWAAGLRSLRPRK